MNTGSKSNNRVILLFGPTAVGKTELITEIFARECEVISADAMQVYRGLDIGTAKPGIEERRRIPHHLIDICDPSEGFDVGSFVAAADEKAGEILSRGKTPIVSGGTAFYLVRFLYGLPRSPRSDPEVRAQVEERLRRDGPEALYGELSELDPATACRVHPNDTYRVTRALEVYHATGRPLSSYEVPGTPRKKWDCLVIGLHRERGELYGRIDERVERMFREGLVEEVRGLVEQGYTEEDPGMKGIGYREFFRMRRAGEHTLEDVKEEIQRNSRRYAKRQSTFFRRIAQAHFIRPGEKDRIRELTGHFLERGLRPTGDNELHRK